MSKSNGEQISPTPSVDLLTPDNCAFLFVDFQPQMFFGVNGTDVGKILNAVVGLAKTAKVFNIPSVVTTVAANTFSGHLIPQVQAEFPDAELLDRTSMNSWEDSAVVDAVKRTGRRKLVLAGLWTEVCILLPTLSAIAQGYEVYVVADACGGMSSEAHDHAITRMTQAGAYPVTWVQVLLELQRDWARSETYTATRTVSAENAGAYGLGLIYGADFLGLHAEG
jgi:nicotinamidase-related amidase